MSCAEQAIECHYDNRQGNVTSVPPRHQLWKALEVFFFPLKCTNSGHIDFLISPHMVHYRVEATLLPGTLDCHRETALYFCWPESTHDSTTPSVVSSDLQGLISRGCKSYHTSNKVPKFCTVTRTQ